jgi:hypothetical protein
LVALTARDALIELTAAHHLTGALLAAPIGLASRLTEAGPLLVTTIGRRDAQLLADPIYVGINADADIKRATRVLCLATASRVDPNDTPHAIDQQQRRPTGVAIADPSPIELTIVAVFCELEELKRGRALHT